MPRCRLCDPQSSIHNRPGPRPDWQRHLVIEPDQVTVVWDDGTADVYVSDGQGGWTAPAGVFDTLAVDDPPDGYLLTSKSQEQTHFDANGRLDWIADASGNQLTCSYVEGGPVDGKLDAVTDASGRVLDLAYNDAGRLIGVSDPINRQWQLLYYDGNDPDNPHVDGPGPLTALEDPGLTRFEMIYGPAGQITNITDQHGDTWGFAYVDRQLMLVTDPAPYDSQTQVLQYFADTTGVQKTWYFDRQGSRWELGFDEAAGNFLYRKDPLGHTQSFVYDDPRPSHIHERTGYVNALGKTWEGSYNDVGAVETLTDPMQHRWTISYDGLNRVISVIPPGEIPLSPNPLKQLTYTYDDPNHPMSVTGITLPVDGQGNDAVTVEMTYYDEAHARGKLKTLTDGNGVGTLYEYDPFGQLWRTWEGALDESWDMVVDAFLQDEVSRLRRSLSGYTGVYPWGSGEKACYLGFCKDIDDCGNVISVYCCCANYDEGEDGGGSDYGDDRYGRSYWQFECPAHLVNGSFDGDASFEYSPQDRQIDVNALLTDGSVWPDASYHIDIVKMFGSLGRLESRELSTDQPTRGTPLEGTQISRNTTHTYNDVMGTHTRTSPDGQVTTWQEDAAGRVEHLWRDQMSVTYTYYDTDLVRTATYGNGSCKIYQYDHAERVTQIRHEWVSDHSVILQLDFTYTAEGLVNTVTETGPDSWAATATYWHDNRSRLIEEERLGTHPYHLSYTYDQGSNRKTKIDHLANRKTEYHYDVDDPPEYQTKNNRLVYYELFDITDPGNPVLVETVWYEYGANQDAGRKGNPTYIVRKAENETIFHGTALQYDGSAELRFAVRQTWEEDDEWCDTLEILNITEYEGSGRRRYMERERNPEYDWLVLPGTTVWTDYDGDLPLGDFRIDEGNGQIIELKAYLPGIAQMDTQSEEVLYFHSDQIGSLRAVTTQYGQPVEMVVYTAFGEMVYGDPGTRYLYAGGWGYELNGDLYHVGHRRYNPKTGRFMERDPTGRVGGFNVYEYVGSSPLLLIDPYGLKTIIENDVIPDCRNNVIIVHYYRVRTVFGVRISSTHINTKRFPINGKGYSGGTDFSGSDKDIDDCIDDHSKRNVNAVTTGQEEGNKHKEDTADYLKGAKKVIPKIPKV